MRTTLEVTVWFGVLHLGGCAPTQTRGSCVPCLWVEPLEAHRTLGVSFSRGLLLPPVLRLRRGVVVAPSAVCPMQSAQHRFTPKLRDTFAWVPDAALAASVPLLGSGLPTALVLAWYAGAVSCCAVPWSAWYASATLSSAWYAGAVLWWCRVVLWPAWYAGAVLCCVVVGLVRRCCAVLCRVAPFVLLCCPLLVVVWAPLCCVLAFSAPLLASVLPVVGPLGCRVRCASLGTTFLAALGWGLRCVWWVLFCSGLFQCPLFACCVVLFAPRALRVRCRSRRVVVVLCRAGVVRGVLAWYAGAVVVVVWCGACGWVVCGVSAWYTGAMVVVVWCGACGWVAWPAGAVVVVVWSGACARAACGVSAWSAGAMVVVVLCGACVWVACGVSAWYAGAVVVVVWCGACGWVERAVSACCCVAPRCVPRALPAPALCRCVCFGFVPALWCAPLLFLSLFVWCASVVPAPRGCVFVFCLLLFVWLRLVAGPVVVFVSLRLGPSFRCFGVVSVCPACSRARSGPCALAFSVVRASWVCGTRWPCCLAPGRVPWLWPAACLSGVPCGPALVRRVSSGPGTLGAPVGFPIAVVPSPAGCSAPPDLLGGCAVHMEAGREPGSWCLPLAPRGGGAGLAPRRTRSGPRCGVVPSGSLWLRSRASCAAVVVRVWIRSRTRPVSRAVCLAVGLLAGGLNVISAT